MPKSGPFTVRLNPRIESRITQIARETKRSKGAVLEELADEAERARRFPGIAFRGPNWSRRAWVLGTALDVWEIVQAFKDYGEKDSMLVFARSKIAEGYDVVVMGHRHQPTRKEVGNGIYINLGDWITHNTYAEFHGGQITLKYWNPAHQ